MTTIAIVGQGYMGNTHAEAWSQLGYGDRIKYVFTPRPGAPLAHAPSAQFVTDFDTVLADPEVTAVSICSPTSSHRDLAVAALGAGKHVLLEKPIALTLEDALAVKQAAESSGSILMVAQVIRFFGGYAQMRADVVQGLLGSVTSARATRVINRPSWSTWWHEEEKSGGVVVDFSIHDYDQLNLFLGEPIAVTAISSDRLGPIETTVEYRNGGIGQVFSFADAAPGVPFSCTLDLQGSAGSSSYAFVGAAPTEGEGAGVSDYVRYGAEGSLRQSIEGDAPYTRQVEYFLACVEAGVQPGLSSTGSAVRALEVSLAARRSLETGTRVELSTVISDADAAGTAMEK